MGREDDVAESTAMIEGARLKIWIALACVASLGTIALIIRFFSDSARGAFLVGIGAGMSLMALANVALLPRERQPLWVSLMSLCIGFVFVIIGWYSISIRL